MLRIELSPEIWLSMKSWRDCAFAFGNVSSARLERGQVRVGLAAGHLHERVEVLRVASCSRPRSRPRS